MLNDTKPTNSQLPDVCSCDSSATSNSHGLEGTDVQQTDIITVNIQGLYPKSNQSKVPFLKEMVQQSNAKFLTMTETHLKQEVLDSEISIEGYTHFRSDRLDRSHGGVIIYAHNSLPCIQLLSHSNQYCSAIIVKATNLNLVLITMYRPPNCPKEAFQDIINRCSECINQQGSPTPDTLLLGDFNFPNMEWPSGKYLLEVPRRNRPKPNFF